MLNFIIKLKQKHFTLSSIIIRQLDEMKDGLSFINKLSDVSVKEK